MGTRNRNSRIARSLGFVALMAGAIAPASAQEDPAKYPTRPIHIIVGFAAGGGNDIVARIFGQKLSESLGQPVIVENKPGGGAIVATEYVAKSPPDGYTLLMSASGISINPAVYAKLPYDAVNDFVAVSELGSFPLIMIVAAASPIKSVTELVAYAKANPDKMNYASSSASFQLVTELFKQTTGAPMQVIPYKSANESVLAVISGQVTMTIADTGSVYSQIKSGTVRALAVAAPRRLGDLPDVPTMKEADADGPAEQQAFGAEPAREQAKHQRREGLQNPQSAEQLQIERILHRQQQREGQRADLHDQRGDFRHRRFAGMADVRIDVGLPDI